MRKGSSFPLEGENPKRYRLEAPGEVQQAGNCTLGAACYEGPAPEARSGGRGAPAEPEPRRQGLTPSLSGTRWPQLWLSRSCSSVRRLVPPWPWARPAGMPAAAGRGRSRGVGAARALPATVTTDPPGRGAEAAPRGGPREAAWTHTHSHIIWLHS